MNYYSPYSLYNLISQHGRWFIKEIKNVFTLYTTNLGSRLRFTTNGVSILTVNVLDNRNEISPSQIYAWRIDNGPWHREQASQSSWKIKTESNSHLIEIMVAGNADLDQVWNGNQGFAITSIKTDQGTLERAPKIPVIDFIGDSITAGCWVAGRHASYDYRPESNYVGTAVDLLHATDVRIAYSAGGVLRKATGGVPTADQFLKNLDEFTPWQVNHPDLVVVNLGVNDRRFPLEQFNIRYNHFLSLITTLFPSSPILIMIPFSQTFANSIRHLAHKHQLPVIETAGWCQTYTDGLHPDQAGAIESGVRLAQKLSNWLK
ncbi:GDSL-type esterase/lipase family protein [Limosilactobacillus fastidiosus]|uniref:SGNH hydrolase-type esterase domain-containing protein n=1 Tax=Limosilactobacillus fastidiosus TaxID=2759855 RepID=A0A7W3TZC3_9LACO|nr:GDSL-type esterase/lipase family protein [Limosilactobacillus fastidiosus]MBB1062677.1 hypothetical protein [Limosilactobacillus fastidiosus]MBB1085775.1 hypothetical protein [Limosilactobacillus fastidiosus]MCD7083953.1 GDSL-type esterase/lipase family protein [Limosilactobacillus fastidiosus]MCD7085888.1 GDSL-type esterase/lipase family protein [Limosilactobacillus fastidiosus]MCD7113965.1 GDSL-type esterase/lipase family protein [Limosilactobacillus fastidiosus]